MDLTVSRRALLLGVPAAGLAAVFPWAAAHAATAPASRPDTVPAGFPRQDQDSVRDVVGASHSNLDRVKELVSRRPELAKATWDWGFGDWETALGAASHVGRPDIARFLIEHGARIDIFAAAMLGNLAAVKAFCEASPGIQRTPGPHGIPLLSHAKAGREAAKAVVDYLEALGDAGVTQEPAPLSDEDRAACAGVFSYGPADADRFEITDSKGSLQFVKAPGPARGLTHVGNREFYPAGARSVRIRLDAAASTATLTDGDLILSAARVG